MSILNQILVEAAQAKALSADGKRRLLAVFDLDSTLFDLTFRMIRIVEAFGADATWKARYPNECARLKTLPIESTDWGLKDGLERVGIFESDHPEFYKDLHEFWAACFFSSNYLHHDEPLPGAQAYVKSLQAAGADIMYLTGRDVPRMQDGTAKSLRESGFPIDEPDVELVLKPVAEMDDAQFKVDVLREVSDRYSKIWLFENEPVNLNLMAAQLPAVGLVFIDSCHSGREQVAKTLDRIKHFEIDVSDFTVP